MPSPPARQLLEGGLGRRKHGLLQHKLYENFDPARQKSGEIYTWNGGRGVYFLDPSGHFLEIHTRPYF